MDTVVVDCLVFPLDTIKTRFQAPDYAQRYPDGRGLTQGLWQGFGPVVVATLPSAALFFTVYEESRAALASPKVPLLGSYLATEQGRHVANSAASVAAELAACMVLAPAETIKQRRQVAKPPPDHHSSGNGTGKGYARTGQNVTRGAAPAGAALPGTTSRTVHAAASLLSSPSELRGLWRGYLALAGRNIPQTALQFPIWERVRTWLSEATGVHPLSRRHEGQARAQAPGSLQPERDAQVDSERRRNREEALTRRDGIEARIHLDEQLPASHYLSVGAVSGASAAIAGSTAAFFTTPLDVVKTRIMLGSPTSAPAAARGSGGGGVGAGGGATSLLLHILRNEGVGALWRGGAMRCAWTALGASIYFGSYEAGREWWRHAGKLEARRLREGLD